MPRKIRRAQETSKIRSNGSWREAARAHKFIMQGNDERLRERDRVINHVA